MFRILVIFMAVAVLSGCQAMTRQTLNPLADQKRFYTDGAVTVASERKLSIAMVAANSGETPNGQRIQLALRVINIGKTSFEIDTADIRVSSPQTKPLKVYSYNELVKEEKQQRTAALILTAISGAANAYSAAQNSTVHSSGTYRSTTYGPSGSYQTIGSYNGSYYDPGRAQLASSIATAQTTNQMNNIAANSDRNLSSLKGAILKRTTVFPNSEHGGMFTFDAPRLKKDELRTYNIQILVAGERHSFELIQSWK